MGASTAKKREIRLEAPETVHVGSRQYRVGGVTYRLFDHLLNCDKRTSTVADLVVAVWGKTAGPKVSKGTVRGAIHRANEVLSGLLSSERIAIDGDVVMFVD